MRRSLIRAAVAAAIPILTLATLPGRAQDAPVPCQAPAYRQFDFWIGDWDVKRTADGAAAGTNSITRILNGCALEENWQSAGGGKGTSYNTYDRTTGKWHQTWVDDTGTLLQLDGALEDGKMVLHGETVGPAGRTRHRVIWTPREDGTVRQLWESSQDGQTWTVAFDGIYSRKK